MDGPEDAMVGEFKRVDSSTPVTRARLSGRLVEGTDKLGELRVKEMLILGREVVLLAASGRPSDFDRAVQRHFFESLLVDPPLTVYASAVGGFSLLVPNSAAEQVIDHDLGSCSNFFLRSAEKLPLVLVCAWRLPPTLQAAPSEAAIRTLSTRVNALADMTPVLAPIRSHGVQGFEITFISSPGPPKGLPAVRGRGRTFNVGGRFLMVAFLSDAPEELNEPSADQILGSLTWPEQR
jgi:hypothetical protein